MFRTMLATSSNWLLHACAWAAQRRCAIRGHDDVLQFAAGRIYLRCVTCGHESAGWRVGDVVAVQRPSVLRPSATGRPPLRRVA